jgi:uracil-DNA glycosylase
MSTLKIEESWKAKVGDEFQKPYMQSLKGFLAEELKSGKTIYPKGADIFAAFNLTPFEKVKVVILGQDPYHGPGQAHGLSFSVKKGTAFPPSLQNIFKELVTDIGCPMPKTGDLTPWAEQGVLLLNATLTVEKEKAGSHQNKGWEDFTNGVIKNLSENRSDLVFILWGSFAQKKSELIDSKKHLILKSPHPSPLSSYRGFFGSQPFSKTNAYLKSKGQKEINWDLTIYN